MIVRRIEVEGGFLDGMDLRLAGGLNVLIGPRGAGKTSVLELLRFALDVPAMTPDAQAQATRQAEAVLGGGRVTVTLETDGLEARIIRNAVDTAPRLDGPVLGGTPLFVSQNELEAIGLDASSRRRILDQIVGVDTSGVDEQAAVVRAREVVSRADELRAERERVLDLLDRVADAPQQLEATATDEEATAETDQQIVSLQTEIEHASANAAAFERRRSEEDQAREELGRWTTRVDQALSDDPDLSLIPADLRPATEAIVKDFRVTARGAVDALVAVQTTLAERSKSMGDQALDLQRALRLKSQQLEALREGAGERARRLAELHRRVEERNALLERLESVERQLLELDGLRAAALDDLDAARNARFAARAREAARLGSLFSNEVEVRVQQAGATAEYAAALGEALQGSGMQYKALARDLASSIGPRELVETVERGDARHLAQVGGISEERAERVIAHLRHHSAASLLLCPVDDSVDFALLDGQTYKLTKELSMGQRCTVVLPLLLAEGRDLTVLDQPEDHLDNAFIVDTLVESLKRRRSDMQLLIATHNANVPVLGDADQVVVLGSNGRRGYVQAAAQLDDPTIVSSITSLMEGGAAAFAERARFYREHAT